MTMTQNFSVGRCHGSWRSLAAGEMAPSLLPDGPFWRLGSSLQITLLSCYTRLHHLWKHSMPTFSQDTKSGHWCFPANPFWSLCIELGERTIHGQLALTALQTWVGAVLDGRPRLTGHPCGKRHHEHENVRLSSCFKRSGAVHLEVPALPMHLEMLSDDQHFFATHPFDKTRLRHVVRATSLVGYRIDPPKNMLFRVTNGGKRSRTVKAQTVKRWEDLLCSLVGKRFLKHHRPRAVQARRNKTPPLEHQRSSDSKGLANKHIMWWSYYSNSHK